MSDHNTAEATANKVVQEPSTAEKKQSPVGRLIFLLITGACFVYLYFRLNGAAARESMPLTEYMTQVFANVAWGPWLTLMVAYSLFYFLIDTLVVTRALNWLLADIKYKDILPIRASAYIISIFNEQIGKGAMAYYLNKRDQIPGWEVGSVMLFIMFCEIFYLLVWATVGYIFGGDGLPEVFQIMPVISIGATILLILWLLYFNGTLLPNNQLREKRILHGFRRAKLWHYGAFFLLRSPALLAAIVVYTTALNLFGVEASFLTLLPYLPVVFFAAAVPTPMRAAAITFWVILFPENEGQMAAFGFVQHNFFILFNAIIGLIFWRRAQRDLFA
ncbi:MAG: hypothetical protein VX166_01740 [Pseudomonadota bacterium]|jgi:hypothetical protein|nr:hypothetical protein [Gammaproteobacteria bacterium]MEC7125990.1 hypothetical protein [Pseudomonadota bacterium]MEC7581076.1 hypothetical protein [Pseudomonadota bacterium]MEC7996491.1 hypothetical protein [Pseudomonadota bacterium]MEC8409893.1 hypothetical protein [Pseudomonadota bacterium]